MTVQRMACHCASDISSSLCVNQPTAGLNDSCRRAIGRCWTAVKRSQNSPSLNAVVVADFEAFAGLGCEFGVEFCGELVGELVADKSVASAFGSCN